jgi:hypothetical protein
MACSQNVMNFLHKCYLPYLIKKGNVGVTTYIRHFEKRMGNEGTVKEYRRNKDENDFISTQVWIF